MKKIFKYLSILLSVALLGSFTACDLLQNPLDESADLGLGIKVFFPTKVVAGQPMTINGSGFAGVKEIVFPGNVVVTDFELVSGEMIRVTAPAGIAADGGLLVVRTADEMAESRLPLTLGRTEVEGYSKQPGETVEGGEDLHIYGKDLQFICGAELLDSDGNPLAVEDKNFYRKGENELVMIIPKNIYKGAFKGILKTFDGREIEMSEFEYTPPTNGGYWDHQENTIWDVRTEFADWSVSFVIPAEKFADAKEGDIIRVYYSDKTADFNPIFKHVDSWADWSELQDNRTMEAAYFEAPITAAILPELQSSGLRFQGVGFAIDKVTLLQDVWVEGGGHFEMQENTLWDEETPFADWSATIAIPAEKFADVAEGAVIRVYYSDKTADFNPIFKHVDSWADWNEFQSIMVVTGEYFESTVSADVIAELQASGLRFQGVGFTVTKITLMQEVWVGGGGHSEVQEIALWEEETPFADWSATIAIPAEKFADVVEGAVIRVYYADKTADFNPIFKHVDSWADWNEFQSIMEVTDEYFQSTVSADVIAELQASGLRFQGVGFTVTKITLTQEVWVGGGGDEEPAEVTLWDQETAFADWSVSFVIPAGKFADVKAGKIIRVFYTDKTADFNPIFKHVDSWADWNEFQSIMEVTDEYFQSTVSDDVIAELQESGLRFQGVGFTVTKVLML